MWGGGGLESGNTGVVDENIYGGEFAREVLPVSFIGHIKAARGGTYVGGDLLCAVEVDVGDDNCRTFGGETLRDCGSDAAARAGDDAGLLGEALHEISLKVVENWPAIVAGDQAGDRQGRVTCSLVQLL